MQLTLAVTGADDVLQVEVGSGAQVDDVKAVAAAEMEVSPGRLEISYKNEVLPDDALLSDVGVEDEDLMALRVLPAEATGSAVGYSQQEGQLQQQGQRRSRGGLGERIRRSLRASLPRVSEEERQRQRYIESQISAQNISENMARAFEESPESFVRVLMLYIDTEVNNVPVKAFIDSGAQTTVMSRACADRCGIMRLVDSRFAGVAVGVGSAQILGRVHIAPIKIGTQLYNCGFSVIDGAQDIELLLGLDMLRRHQAMIDLRNDCLHIGEPEELVPFLSESETPEYARHT
ncbi:DNA damage-inducible protein 1 [Hondaea fermentalgiana]|uniref:DNA damage-inducible protein 1 n=1 Tax=Hondaea fermentalgiana TaxID=2315210 RepID=A0A2R5GNL3_9STRA|nr:DNA damage-inducible protein 1 [Hondaea fermentalgiana]|eukprot:GBG32482.1 DNA damage-inducible protein 1 [Hondaea fermentalgiana]